MSEFIPLVFIGCFFILFLYFFPKRNKIKSSKLIDFFSGTISWPLGTVEFCFEKIKYRVSRISKGRALNNSGTFPFLWTYVESSPKIIVGNVNSRKYTDGQFLWLPPNEEIEVGGNKFLIGSSDIAKIELMRNFVSDSDISSDFSVLFNKDFEHLTIGSEIHFLGFLPRKKYVLKYTCLPEDIYADPQILIKYLQSIHSLVSKLGLQFR